MYAGSAGLGHPGEKELQLSHPRPLWPLQWDGVCDHFRCFIYVWVCTSHTCSFFLMMQITLIWPWAQWNRLKPFPSPALSPCFWVSYGTWQVSIPVCVCVCIMCLYVVLIVVCVCVCIMCLYVVLIVCVCVCVCSRWCRGDWDLREEHAESL